MDLHDLGVALNFREQDRRFLGTFILNPEWVTEGVYKIINTREAVGGNGVLPVEQLDAILDPATYPPHMHHFILDVMTRFELCFPLEGGGAYLIPGLLSKQEPELVWDFADNLPERPVPVSQRQAETEDY